MKKNEIDKFIKDNEKQDIIKYFDELNAKLKELNKKYDKNSLLILLLILIYYIIDKNIITSINIGIVALNDISLTKLFIPPIFAFFLFIYATLNSHKTEIEKVIQQIGESIFHIDKEKNSMKNILNLLLPFSFWKEFNDKYLDKGNWWSFIFILPLLSVLIVPLIFQIIVIKDLFVNYWDNGFIEKLITITTIWIFSLTIMYYLKSFSKKRL